MIDPVLAAPEPTEAELLRAGLGVRPFKSRVGSRTERPDLKRYKRRRRKQRKASRHQNRG